MRKFGRKVRAASLATTGLMLMGFVPAFQSAQAVVPGTNGKIVFDNGNDIFTMSPDGSGVVSLTAGAILEIQPAWSPDGTQIAFNRAGAIWKMNADGTAPVAVTAGAMDSEPTWSPDGTQIAFTRNVGGGGVNEIFIVGASGGPAANLTASAGDDSHPTWSPDGTTITFTSQRGGVDFDIWKQAVDGMTPAVQLEAAVGNGLDPAYSPNGQTIIYSQAPGTLMTVPAAGGPAVPLPVNATGIRPAYSPDGKKIVYQDAGNISIANANGSLQATVTPGSNPDWQPLNPFLTVTPTAVNFGNVIVGEAKTESLTVKNTGIGTKTSPVTAVVTAGAADYSIDNNCTGPLAPGGTCTIDVTFAPSTTGTRPGTVEVDDPIIVSLTGVGLAPAPPTTTPTTPTTAPPGNGGTTNSSGSGNTTGGSGGSSSSGSTANNGPTTGGNGGNGTGGSANGGSVGSGNTCTAPPPGTFTLINLQNCAPLIALFNHGGNGGSANGNGGNGGNANSNNNSSSNSSANGGDANKPKKDKKKKSNKKDCSNDGIPNNCKKKSKKNKK